MKQNKHYGKGYHKKKQKKIRNPLLKILLLAVCSVLALAPEQAEKLQQFAIGVYESITREPTISLDEIPEYDGEPYVIINDNIPDFSEEDFTTTPFEIYSDLDVLGRCGVAYANICEDLMPTEKRQSIQEVHPTGWKNKKYDIVDQESLYNRCHLIGFQLAGENANEKNLITGTRYMNVEGMLPFENEVADYVHQTDGHVLYRVTPIFDGLNLVASGVEMEAESVEDQGEGVRFHVYVYNVQPGIEIDYRTGENKEAADYEKYR